MCDARHIPVLSLRYTIHHANPLDLDWVWLLFKYQLYVTVCIFIEMKCSCSVSAHMEVSSLIGFQLIWLENYTELEIKEM